MLYDSERGDFTLALTGDVMLTRKLDIFTEPKFLGLRELLVGADVTFANLEGPVRHPHEGHPNISIATYMTTPPRYLADLKWFGIDLVSCANNHIFDFGEQGLLATLRHLDEAGIPHAGGGANLAEASAPAYLDSPAGRVGLVAVSCTHSPWLRAGEQRNDIAGRPGVNPLDHQATCTVDAASFAELQRLSRELGFSRATERNKKHFFSDREIGSANETELTFLGRRFVRGDGFAINTKANTADWERNLRAVREARRMADWVAVSVHSHEFGGQSTMRATSRSELEEPADFVADFSRAAIDAGADVVVGHGSHTPLGIEFYQGKPILHSVGSLIFQNESVTQIPADAYQRFGLGHDATPADFLDARTAGDTKGHPASPGYWENIVAICQFESRELTEIRIHPIDQGHGRSRAQRGRPLLAEGSVAHRILQRVQRLCERYGVGVAIAGDIGIVSARDTAGLLRTRAASRGER